MIERNHLTILKAIKQHGTLSAAAKSICLTQSALSQSIKKLEGIYSISIWEKSGRNLRLTEAGEYLLGVASRLLPQLENADQMLQKFGQGFKGTLRIGMECHPCYKWLLKVIDPFLNRWSDVDVDIKRQFTFGGIAALYQHEIDLLVTPDPLLRKGLKFYPVFSYEQVLVVPESHPLAGQKTIEPVQLLNEVILTYPIEQERLDIYRDFLLPAQILPKKQVHIEDTDILFQMVSSQRGVTALPLWMVEEYRDKFRVVPVRLGKKGIHKKINLGVREGNPTDYLLSFLEMASQRTL